MRRPAATLIASALLAVALFFVGLALPVPYVRLVPGPVTDTLGAAGGKPLIEIKGHDVATTTSGHIYLVTVGEYGGPGQDLSALSVLKGWWDDTEAIVPTRVLYGPDETAQQVQKQDAAQMDMSQENAKVAALRYLGYQLQPGVLVAGLADSSAADGKLEVGDVIVDADGARVSNTDQLLAITKKHSVGDEITLRVNRDGQTVDVPVTLGKALSSSGGPSIGISVVDSFTKPFEIDIRLNDVGGPSAGMAFALGIIDKLSAGDLTGGHSIAGTGTIDADGDVGAIGGVQQKMVGARDAGATAFLVPAGNCAEASAAVPKGLRLVKVSTLSGAVSAIKALADGGSAPSCRLFVLLRRLKENCCPESGRPSRIASLDEPVLSLREWRRARRPVGGPVRRR
jgi:PDZ domain-containing protein